MTRVKGYVREAAKLVGVGVLVLVLMGPEMAVAADGPLGFLGQFIGAYLGLYFVLWAGYRVVTSSDDAEDAAAETEEVT